MRAAAKRALAEARPRASHPGRRRRLARRHRRDRGPARRRRTGVRVLHRPGKDGLGPRLPRRLRRGAGRRRRLRAGDGRRLLPRPRGPRRGCSRRRADGADLVLGSRYVPGGGVSDWGSLRRLISRGRLALRARACSGCSVHDLTGGFKCFRARGARGDRPDERALAGLRLPGRADLPRAAAPGFASSRCRSCSASAARASRRCPARIALEAVWRVPAILRLAAARRGEPTARRSAPNERTTPGELPIPRGAMPMRGDGDFVLVQGLRTHARDAASAGTLHPGRVLGRGAGSARSPSAGAAARRLGRGAARHARSSRLRHRRPQPTDLARGRGAGPVPQLARARAARDGLRRGFIAGCSMPLEAEEVQRRLALGPRQGRAAGDRLRRRARRPSRSCTQAYVLGHGASTLAAQLGVPPGLLLLGLLPHALPELIALFLPLAAWIIASRRDDWDQLLAATFVTVGHRRPGARRARLRRGLRLAPPAPRAGRLTDRDTVEPRRSRGATDSLTTLCIVLDREANGR